MNHKTRKYMECKYCGKITKGKDYCKGHHPNSRGNRKTSKEMINFLKIIKSCKCGCGKKIKIMRCHKRMNIPRFIRGHHPWTKGRREKVRRANIGKIASEKTRKKLSLSHMGKLKGDKNPAKRLEVRKKLKKARARQSPTFTSSIEVKIQNFLKQLGIEFFTHQYMNIKHSYQCDILIPCMNLVIECDGDYWHGNPILYPNPNNWQQEKINRDKIRTIELIKAGFKVLRLWEFEINEMSINEFKNRLMGVENA